MSDDVTTRWRNGDTLEIIGEITCKNGNMRSARITDAMKFGWIPSVTSVLNITAKGLALDKYIYSAIIDAVLAHPTEVPVDALRGEPLRAYKDEIIKIGQEDASQKAKRGSELHTCLEQYLQTATIKTFDPIGKKIAKQIKEWLADEMDAVDIVSEKTLGGRKQGFAGQADIIATTKEGKTLICDLKTKEDGGGRVMKFYKGNKLQLGAYRNLTGSTADLWILLGGRNEGTFIPKQVENAQWQEERFLQLFDFWCMYNSEKGGYDPRTWTKEKK